MYKVFKLLFLPLHHLLFYNNITTNRYMNLKIFLLAVSAVFSLPMDAQSRLRNSRSHKVDTVPVLVKSYMDSLSVSKAKIDSAAG